MREQVRVNITTWGHEKIIADKSYCGKYIYIIKNARTSLQYYPIKESTFFIESGKVMVYYTDVTPNNIEECALNGISGNMINITLNEGDCFCMKSNKIYQIIAVRDSCIYECSTADEDAKIIHKGGL